jgi:hypothetical protein
MSHEGSLYHWIRERGYWTGTGYDLIDLRLRDGTVHCDVAPVGFLLTDDGELFMVLKTSEDNVRLPVNDIPGLRVVRGDSSRYPHEKDGEFLVEFTYFKGDRMEDKPRRIRPFNIRIGIMGSTDEESNSHRALGEKVDFYIQAQDTQYHAGEDGSGGIRNFPFWRMGVYGDASELAGQFLPEPPQD